MCCSSFAKTVTSDAFMTSKNEICDGFLLEFVCEEFVGEEFKCNFLSQNYIRKLEQFSEK